MGSLIITPGNVDQPVCETCGKPLYKGKYFCSQECRRRRKIIPLAERLMRRAEFLDNGCWLWTGVLNAKGYGSIWVGPLHNDMEGVHRVSYSLFVGEIPTGKEIDHACHNPQECNLGILCPHRRCFNPSHLTAITHQENIARSGINNEPGRSAAREKKISTTHCRHGHEYTPENTYTYNGARCCRTCGVDRKKVYRINRADREAKWPFEL